MYQKIHAWQRRDPVASSFAGAVSRGKQAQLLGHFELQSACRWVREERWRLLIAADADYSFECVALRCLVDISGDLDTT